MVIVTATPIPERRKEINSQPWQFPSTVSTLLPIIHDEPIDVINLHAYTCRVIFSNLSSVSEVASCASVIIASCNFRAHWVYSSLVCYRGIHQLPLLYVLTASFRPVYILFHLIHPAHITKSHYTLRHRHRVTLRCHNLVIPRIIRCNFPD